MLEPGSKHPGPGQGSQISLRLGTTKFFSARHSTLQGNWLSKVLQFYINCMKTNKYAHYKDQTQTWTQGIMATTYKTVRNLQAYSWTATQLTFLKQRTQRHAYVWSKFSVTKSWSTLHWRSTENNVFSRLIVLQDSLDVARCEKDCQLT